MTFTKETLEKIRKVLTKHLDEAGYELEIDFSLGSIRYEDQSFTVKLTALTDGYNPKEEALLKHHPDWHNKVVNISGENFKIVGWNAKARKNKVLLERNGRSFAAQPSVVRSKMDRIHNLKWKDVS